MTMIEYLCLALYFLGAYQTKEMVDIVCESRGCEYHILTTVFSCLIWPLVTLFVLSARAVSK